MCLCVWREREMDLVEFHGRVPLFPSFVCTTTAATTPNRMETEQNRTEQAKNRSLMWRAHFMAVHWRDGEIDRWMYGESVCVSHIETIHIRLFPSFSILSSRFYSLSLLIHALYTHIHISVFVGHSYALLFVLTNLCLSSWPPWISLLLLLLLVLLL